MAFKETFDEIFNRILDGYANQFPSEDMSVGGAFYKLAQAITETLLQLLQEIGLIQRMQVIRLLWTQCPHH